MKIHPALSVIKTLVFTATAVLALSNAVRAKDVTVDYTVSAAHLNLSDATGAREFYRRVKLAAQVVCTHGRRVDLVPLEHVQSCVEKTIRKAVRSANKPELTALYLQSHKFATPIRADVVVQVAAR
jgi:UrcA family protein